MARCMDKTTFIAQALTFFATLSVVAHEPVTRARTDVNIPDVGGYLTLKCDFHTHTVFSDGYVWPSVRSEEAWREGLDVIAITDHIEYRPHKADVSTNHNRSYQIARSAGEDLGLIVVKGSEITRSMPPGHINAIFLTNSSPLDVPEWRNSTRIAHEQGAFIFWNHPGWDRQLTHGQVVWYPEHTKLLEKGMLNGIEVVNARDYYPEAHRWAIEKKLTMLANSDIHSPLNMDYHVHAGDHRPMTLVFATGRTQGAVKEALMARRTAVYSGNRLIGDEQFLRPIFDQSVRFKQPSVTLRGSSEVHLQLSNTSDLDFVLERATNAPGVSVPKSLTLPAHKTVLFEVKAEKDATPGQRDVEAEYRVTNLLIGPGQPLVARLRFQVNITSDK
jgi:predicted metal-dependent phosphoesterase TrpH